MGEYVKRYVRRGIPSLLQSLKGLYADEAKVTIIGEVFESFLARPAPPRPACALSLAPSHYRSL